MRDSILILGTGAMACLFGARLAAHAPVTLLGTWPEGLAALRGRGIILESDGREVEARVGVASDPADCAGARHALVLVKSYQTERAAQMLEQCLAPEGVAITLQNGIGNIEILHARLGASRAAQGVTTSGATLLGPGRVRPGGQGAIHLGDHPRVAPIADLFRRSGLPVEITEEVETLVWAKAVINASINPLTALLRIPNGGLAGSPGSGASILAAEVAAEAAAVMAARGLQFPYPDPAARVFEVARHTAHNRSSMLQDVERGRPTEIDAINGAVVLEGERLGVPTPVNRVLWHLVRSLSPGRSQEDA